MDNLHYLPSVTKSSVASIIERSWFLCISQQIALSDICGSKPRRILRLQNQVRKTNKAGTCSYTGMLPCRKRALCPTIGIFVRSSRPSDASLRAGTRAACFEVEA